MTVATAPAANLSATSREAMDAAVRDLQAHRQAWTQVSVRDRISLLEELIRTFLPVAERWADAAIEAEGIDRSLPTSGEEALVGPYFVIRNLRLLRKALWDVEVHGRPRIPGSVRVRPDGQVTARVFPYDVWDQVFYTGVTADVWMEPGVTVETLPETMAVAYNARERKGAVALVLGGGNVTSIGPMDALYKLFVEDQVVLFKTHPANVYLGPLLEEGMKPLVDRGFLRLVYGGADRKSTRLNSSHSQISYAVFCLKKKKKYKKKPSTARCYTSTRLAACQTTSFVTLSIIRAAVLRNQPI